MVCPSRPTATDPLTASHNPACFDSCSDSDSCCCTNCSSGSSSSFRHHHALDSAAGCTSSLLLLAAAAVASGSCCGCGFAMDSCFWPSASSLDCGSVSCSCYTIVSSRSPCPCLHPCRRRCVGEVLHTHVAEDSCIAHQADF